MRIVHLSVARRLTPGQAKQLGFEHAAAQRLEGVVWQTLACHTGPVTDSFMCAIPRLFRSLFMRQLYGWIVALRLSKQYDIIMMRHMTFDPFALIFAPLISNRVSVHHAKEVEELRLIRKGWRGWAASNLERITARVAARHAMAILGVTREIAEYERNLYAPGKLIGVYPNGIDPMQAQLLGDRRTADGVEAVFMCGTFSEWHGLDKLIAAVDANENSKHDVPVVIHLVGKLTDQQKYDIEATRARRCIFKHHGEMTADEYRPLLERCDIGIASLAMERQNLREGATLKVREMLAMGLAIYSGHEDMALPTGESFVRICGPVNLPDIIAFGISTKTVSRDYVRNMSLTRIDKMGLMASCVSFFRGLEKKRA